MFQALIRKVSKDPILFQDNLNPSLQLLLKILGKDRRPSAHVLGFEILYFIRSRELEKCFPLMAEDWPVHKNITLMHFSMLNQRLQYEETKESLQESKRLALLCEKYLFERYLDLVEDLIDLPVKDFEAELVEMIVKDFYNIDSEIACYGYNKSYIMLDERPGFNILAVITNTIFENKIPPFDPQIKKMLQYFIQHVPDMEMSLVKDIQTQYKDEYTENFEIITTYKILEDEEYANEDAIKLVNNNERRRLPYQIQDDKWNYIPKLCENKWNCRFGLNCHFAHSRLEQIYHPSNFKVKKCENDIIADDDYCLKSGANCTFYHNDYEKRTSGLQKRVFDLSTYKIYKCNKVGCDENCINYHDITERRRDPTLFSYSEVPCINVRPGTDFLPRNCENGDYCNLAHSKNEVYYHENNYKKRTCFRVDCRLKYCAFTHVTNETTSETKKVQESSEVDSRQFTGFMSNGSRSASVVSSKHTEHKPEDSSSDFNGVDVPEADTKIYNCKSCQSSEITYMFTTCGASLCISCLTKVCYICKVAHLNTVKF